MPSAPSFGGLFDAVTYLDATQGFRQDELLAAAFDLGK